MGTLVIGGSMGKKVNKEKNMMGDQNRARRKCKSGKKLKKPQPTKH